MAKWYGKVGYAITNEVEPGVWENKITEREHYGDAISNRFNHQNNNNVNDGIRLSNIISIIADPFANQHCSDMVYVEYMGAKWKIESFEPQFPRILSTIGGVYNGEQS